MFGKSAYSRFDPVLMSWAHKRDIHVETDDRGWDVRSIWIHDCHGNRRAQMWFDVPDEEGYVKIIASALDPNSPTQWGAREERKASKKTLEQALDELWSYMLVWARNVSSM